MELLALVLMVAQPLAIAVYAQKRQARVGVVWALVALAFDALLIWLLFLIAPGRDTPPGPAKDALDLIAVFGISTIATLAILLTLPRKGQAG